MAPLIGLPDRLKNAAPLKIAVSKNNSRSCVLLNWVAVHTPAAIIVTQRKRGGLSENCRMSSFLLNQWHVLAAFLRKCLRCRPDRPTPDFLRSNQLI